MRKKIMNIAAAMVLALAGFLVSTAAPAEASWNACPSNHFCMWEHTNYWGIFDPRQYPVNTCLNSATYISSIRNNRPKGTYIYTGSACNGTAWLVSAYQSYSPMPSAIGDNGMRSFKMIG